jgi:hypothetical protein
MADDTQRRTRPKTSLVSRGLAKDVLEVLVSIAEAVPVLGAPVKGSLEALKQIVEYTQVSSSSWSVLELWYELCVSEQHRF